MVTRLGIIAFCVLASGSSSLGAVLGSTPLKIDFTKPNNAANQITWFPQEHLALTDKGFGWDGEENASRDGWIETTPLAIGTSWRPTQNAELTVKLGTDFPAVIQTGKSSKAIYVPRIFVRYSCDKQHWSDWQPLNVSEDPRHPGEVLFTGSVGVARKTRQNYEDRLQAWSKRTDVAWSSDEEAFCTWLLTQEPTFFEHHRPFVGYVQLLLEDSFSGGKHLKSIDAEIAWGVSGLHAIPKDPAAQKKHEGASGWRFSSK